MAADRARAARRRAADLAGLLTFWPRATPRAAAAALTPPDRGYPFVALAVLLVVVASPVVSLGGTSSLLLGLALAALTVCFLWLERLPLKPGSASRRCSRVALAARCRWRRGRPRRAVVRLPHVRREPRARRSRALLLGRRATGRSPGRATATRSCGSSRGAAVLEGAQPRRIQQASRGPRGRRRPSAASPTSTTDLPRGLGGQPVVDEHDRGVSIRRMRITDVIGAGTIVDVRDALAQSRAGDLARDTGRAERSCAAATPTRPRCTSPIATRSSSPRRPPARTSARRASASSRCRSSPARSPRPGRGMAGVLANAKLGPVKEAEVHFAAWDGAGEELRLLPGRAPLGVRHRQGHGALAYERTWALSKRLKRGAEHPMDYIRAVDDYLLAPSSATSSARRRRPPARRRWTTS